MRSLSNYEIERNQKMDEVLENEIEKMGRIIYMVSAPKRGCSALFFFVFSQQIR